MTPPVWLITAAVALVLVLSGLHLATARRVRKLQKCGRSQILDVGQRITFRSPNYPKPYNRPINCRWKFVAPRNTIINLECPVFHTRKPDISSSCTVDKFKFSLSGDASSKDTSMYCGNHELNVNTTSYSLYVYFKSQYNKHNTAKGFRCVVTVLGPKPTYCGTSKYLQFGKSYIFTSPYYPEPYPGPTYCHWKFSAPENAVINLDCQNFDVGLLNSTSGCTSDIFYFTPVGDKTIGNNAIYCGNHALNTNITSTSLHVSFNTSYIEHNSAQGFQCAVTAIIPELCVCGAGFWWWGHDRTGIDSSRHAIPYSDKRDAGAVEVDEGEFPWQAAIVLGINSRLPICGGSLISADWVLTSAYCVIGFNPHHIFVILGMHDIRHISVKESVHNISQIIPHRDYDIASHNNDIAVLKLLSSVRFNDVIRPVCFPSDNSQMFDGDKAVVSGWGWGLMHEKGMFSDVLHAITLQVINNTRCAELNDFNITDNQVCAIGITKDTCHGDSGGPLVRQDSNGCNQQIGIVSHGIGCVHPDKHGFYTRVSKYIDWMTEAIYNRSDMIIT